MNNLVRADNQKSGNQRQGWSAGEVVGEEGTPKRGFFHWWYHFTTAPEPPSSASFVKREASRKMRLVSVVCFYFIVTMLFCLPASFFTPNHIAILTTSIMLVIPIISLVLNRLQYQLLAGILLVVALQLSIMLVIVTTVPLDEASLPIYAMLIMTEVLAVSLLPARSVFIVAILNILFTVISIGYQHHTAALDADIAVQGITMRAEPISLQIIVATISYLWVTSAQRAAVRADRAEMVATLEHELGEHKRDLEEGIEQILQTHVAVANGNLNARAPLTQESVLWQLARALNTLLVRFQRASMAEKELQRVEHAVTATVRSIQQAEQQQQQPRLTLTQSALDPLIVALHGKTVVGIQHSHYSNQQAEQMQGISTPYPQGIFGDRGH